MRKRMLGILKDVPGWLTIHEGQFLEKAALLQKRKSGAIVEIGSFRGKSTIWLSLAGDRVWAIDPHKGEFSGGRTASTLPGFLKNLSRAGVRTLVTPVLKRSKDAARSWHRPIKLLFIDALHDEVHAKEDYMLWSPHVVAGGMVLMHDAFCGWQGAGDVAMRHIAYGGAYREIGVIGSIIYGVKGKPWVVSRMNKLRNQLVIELCMGIYRAAWIPRGVAFVLVHRFLRIFLINRFTSFC